MLEIQFTPCSKDNPEILSAIEEYRAIWNTDGSRIIDAIERTAGLSFRQERIKVEIYEGMSHSGSDDLPIKLRASYSLDVKKGTLIHELGHRLIDQLDKRPADLDEHHILFLILYDAWIELYGQEFADGMVKTERLRKGYYDYGRAWEDALDLSKNQRHDQFISIKALNQL